MEADNMSIEDIAQDNEGFELYTFDADVSRMDEISGLVESHLEEAGASFKSTMQILVALEEIFVNIAHYAYNGKKGKMILGIKEHDGIMELRFIDRGQPFNPLEQTDPDLSLSVEDRDIGGLGILMVKKTMDDVQYMFKEGMNILTLTKRTA